MPIIDKYEVQGKVKKIDSNQDADKVYADILAAFDGHLDDLSSLNNWNKSSISENYLIFNICNW